MSLVYVEMVYVEIYIRGNVAIYYKATGIDMQNLAVAGVMVIVIHIGIVIKSGNETYASHMIFK